MGQDGSQLTTDTHRIQAALHHSRFGDQAGETADDEALEDVDVGLVCHLVPLVRVCLTA